MKSEGKKIYGEMKQKNKLTITEKNQMLTLMKEYYEDVLKENFDKDLEEKDYCIMLYNEEGEVKGFSTQRLITLKVQDRKINGVFSGDTIIDKDYWGSLELYRVFAKEFIRDESDFYWFLISKGYKTYKMLPLFFKEFYPNYKQETPLLERTIMDTFGKMFYPKEYDKAKGVIKYIGIKDKLKSGVADITRKQIKDKDINYFTDLNPGYIYGEDLVCLARLNGDNLRRTAKRLLGVKEND